MVLFNNFIYFFSFNNPTQTNDKIEYPISKQVDTVDYYFGTTVPDPYRWLENDQSNDTKEWVKQQNKLTQNYLSQIPYRDKLKLLLLQMLNVGGGSTPFTEGGVNYFYRNDGLRYHPVLYRQEEEGNPEIFLDPNTFSLDGSISLGQLAFSKNGKKVAYSIIEGGSEWRKIVVMDVVTKKILGDTLTNVKFSNIAWKGNDGFFYSSFDEPKEIGLSAKTDHHKLYYHQLGTSQYNDQLVFGDQHKPLQVNGRPTEDDQYLVITTGDISIGNGLYIKNLTKPHSPIIPLIEGSECIAYVLALRNETLYIVTNLNAPNKKIVTVNVHHPEPKNWKDFIPEKESVLHASKASGYFFARYEKDAISYVEQYDEKGNKVREIELPGIGTAEGFSGKKEDSTLYFSFSNYYTPHSFFRFNPHSGASEKYWEPTINFKPEDYISEQIFYTSKDGTKIPMIITYKKGISLNGKNPTLLYGYGGFNVSLTPFFSPFNALWMSQGGIYAVANLRGGGEYGKKWHTAGTKMNKQNVFDDFIAAAEYLINQKYTSSDFLAIQGSSNGGLLVGAVMTQRPDLIKVALPASGVLDMLRYHKFGSALGWTHDYGHSESSKEMFEYLFNYSPLHQVKAGVAYPATFITCGDHDDRVIPDHSFKFAATLQQKQTGSNPIFVRIETMTGHGEGISALKILQEEIDMISFAWYQMNYTPPLSD